MAHANLGNRVEYSAKSRPVVVRAAGTGRGGARNFADRQSQSIKSSTADNLRQAARFASSIGLPLNRHMTINLEALGVADHRATEAISSFMKSFREWLKRQGHNTASIWARERSSHTGSHLHLLFHLPPGAQLRKRHLAILKRITGRRYKTGCVLTRSVRGASGAQGWELYLSNIERVVEYALKGEMKDRAGAFSRPRSPQGVIIGKRAGTSQNIGQAARQKSSWVGDSFDRSKPLYVRGTFDNISVALVCRMLAATDTRTCAATTIRATHCMRRTQNNLAWTKHGWVTDRRREPAQTCWTIEVQTGFGGPFREREFADYDRLSI
ncbi:hypothetical protein [uncultured Parasphingopyxis sp.]|uniref:rolling circle replication-associated protein n=1 Tax=uncultured Parasphingopyxis sp. TaxID=1547918 RepID=UPI0026232BD4|nr:hypothetical protein [uncultured Parasphingopyxis sp.]